MSPISTASSRWPLHRVGLTLVLTGLLAACGGGGSVDVPRFESTTVNGVAAVRDNVTGIVWAAQLGSTGLSSEREPAAAELLQLTDRGTDALATHFPFVLDAASPLIRARDVVNGVDGRVWVVDFGVASVGGLSDQAVSDTDVNSLYVLSRRSSAPSVTYPSSPDTNGTVTAGGLTWKVCSEGATWSGSACTGTASLLAAAGAQALADAANTARFAGVTGWRVPTQQELRKLLKLENNLSGSGNLLPATFSVDSLGVVPQYWSSSFSSDLSMAWLVDFSGAADPGGIDLAPATDSAHVRLVRTAP